MRWLIDIGGPVYLMSPWAAKNLFVHMKDSGTRVTSDFSALNNVTEMDAYPTEDVYITLNLLSSKKIYSTFHLNVGLFQVVVDDVSKPLTAVRTVQGPCSIQGCFRD